MDKIPQPQQLSFSFDVPVDKVEVQQQFLADEDSMRNIAVVYDFKSAVKKREASNKASLYRQILDSVRHIG